jgi:hypothetical protein
VSEDYLNENLRRSRSKERRGKYEDGTLEYTSVLPVSDLSSATPIEKGADLTKSEVELEDILPISTIEKRIITCKDS